MGPNNQKYIHDWTSLFRPQRNKLDTYGADSPGSVVDG